MVSFTEVLIYFALYELVCVLWGAFVNYVFLPKGSTVSDLFYPPDFPSLDDDITVPLYYYLIPGANIIFVVLTVISFVLAAMIWPFEQLGRIKFFKKIGDSISNFFINLKNLKIK